MEQSDFTLIFVDLSPCYPQGLRILQLCGTIGGMDWREIEAELRALGVTLGEFYERAGIHRSTWGRLREGKFEPRAETARRISAALKVLRAELANKPPEAGKPARRPFAGSETSKEPA